jgi:hypothetical protein
MIPPDEFDSWLDKTMRSSAPAPARDVLARVLRVPSQPIPETRFDFTVLFTFWQKTLAGGAVFASLMAGVLFGQLQSTSSTELDWSDEDIPGLSYSPGEWGDLQ